MEKGKFYKSKTSNLIVLCTKNSKDKPIFCGAVVSDTEDKYKTGDTHYRWRCASFEECTFKSNLESNGSYSIPDGCIVTIKDNRIIIENIVRHYYEFNDISEIYTRIEGENVIMVVMYINGSSDILFKERRKINSDGKTECTEAEFLDVYNEAYLKKSTLIDFLKNKK